MVASPYGFWTSPITSDLVVADFDPSRAGRARRRRNLLERDSAAEAGTNFRLPHRRGRGARTRDARRRQRFQRSRARSRVWRRLVRRQRRRDLFLEQYRSAALSPGCGPAAEPDHACSSRRRCGCVPVRRWRHRPPPGAHGFRPGGSHRRRRGDHYASRRRPFRRDRQLRFSSRATTSIRRHVSAPTETACPGSPGAIPICRGWRPRRGSGTSSRMGRSEIRAGSRAGRTSRCSSRNGRLTGISISYRTEVRAGGISIASATARSSPWRRWTPNSGDRNGSSACRPTRSSPPIA